jgi:rubrerythrin
MGTLFYINEVVNFAVEREQESYALYKELAEKVENQKMKGVFQTLMEEEKKHEVYYSELLSTVEQKRTPSAQGYDEYDEYMRTLIDAQRTVTTPPVDMANLEKIIDFSIAREKDAVLFYTGLENYVPDKDQPTVRVILKEEATHIVKLSKLKQELG